MWLHESLLAIPLISLQFFYLYSISVLIAVIARSTLASLLGTVLFWFMVFMIQFLPTRRDDVSRHESGGYRSGHVATLNVAVRSRSGKRGVF